MLIAVSGQAAAFVRVVGFAVLAVVGVVDHHEPNDRTPLVARSTVQCHMPPERGMGYLELDELAALRFRQGPPLIKKTLERPGARERTYGPFQGVKGGRACRMSWARSAARARVPTSDKKRWGCRLSGSAVPWTPQGTIAGPRPPAAPRPVSPDQCGTRTSRIGSLRP